MPRSARRRHRTAPAAVVALLVAVLALVGTACLPPLVVPSTSGRSFGEGPLDAVHEAAKAKAACGLDAIQLAAMMMAPTYSEAGGPVPSPMALSRWDNVSVNATNVNLFAFGRTSGPYVGAFWSPGIGMWQFDSAGGWPFSAAGAIDSVTSANQAATTMSYRWCNAPTSQQADPAARRKYAWGPWYGCSTTSVCETVYASLVSGSALDTAFDPSVTRYGGMEQRLCDLAGVGTALPCWFVDPARAQGSKGWTGGTYSGGTTGVTPLPKPFYVVEAGGREYRVWLPQDTGFDIAVSGSKLVTANARTGLTWSSTAALCDVTTGRGQCSDRVAQTPTGPRTAVPFGSLDTAVGAAARTLTATGWAIDPDTNDPIQVHVYVDGVQAGAVLADRSRPDVGQAVPGYGDAHGYTATVTGVAPGNHTVCTYGINVGPRGSTNPQLGCLVATVPGDPFGSLDGVATAPAGVRATGWAVDPDGPAPVAVHLYLDGNWAAATTAGAARDDVAAVLPWAGAAHGYDVVVPAGGGVHELCAWAINNGPTGTRNVRLGCASAVVDGSPLGSLDAVAPAPGGVAVRGWAFDPDTGSATVRVRVDGGAPVALSATGDRSDVAAAFPGRGGAHGFAAVVPAAPGAHQVCATAVNEGPTGTARDLGCARVTVLAGAPVGSLDTAVRSGGTARLTGWSIDPDVAGAVAVHVYVDGAWGGAFAAGADRPDVGAAFPGYGSAHGYDVTVAVPPTAATVCVYAIDVASQAGNPLLGCRRL